MQNWFNTLNEALASEGLLHTWTINMSPISYGENRRYTYLDNSKYGHLITVFRETDGRYERPVHYARG
jgi:hypothetical protein